MTLCYDETGTRCSDGPQPGAVALRDFGLTLPGLGDSGIFNCRPVRGGSTLSEHGEGRAWDARTVVVTDDGDHWFNFLWQNAEELGVQLVIYDHEVWSGLVPFVHAYFGTNPHTDHVHGGLCWHAARDLTVAELRAVYERWTEGELDVKEILAAIKGLRNAVRRIRMTQLRQGELIREIARDAKVDNKIMAAFVADLDETRTEAEGDAREVDPEHEN